jgi:hypothetical protein
MKIGCLSESESGEQILRHDFQKATYDNNRNNDFGAAPNIYQFSSGL